MILRRCAAALAVALFFGAVVDVRVYAQESGAEEPSGTASSETPPEDGGSVDAPSLSADTSSAAASPEGAQGGEGSQGATGNGGDAIIDTGDATSIGEVENQVNSNDIDYNNGTTTSTSTPDIEQEGTMTASTTNDAVIETDMLVGAETGNNSATTTVATSSGDARITTGQAVAVANVVNLANTNIFNSEGFFMFLLNLFNGSFNLDFRDFSFFDPPEVELEGAGSGTASVAGGCSGDGCDAEDLRDVEIANTNTATVTNSVIVRAGTGENEAAGDDAGIDTGDAYAVGNVMNVVNTNIVDSNYLLMTFNNIGDWNGDIVFPAIKRFRELFQTGGEACGDGGDLTVNATNDAVVENNATTTAETGENLAVATTSEASATIETGDAHTSTNVVNQVNTNLLCSDSFSLLLRVHGSWTGNMFDVPEDVLWSDTGDGIELYFANGEGGMGPGQNYDITNDNEANITNNVEITALTGENKVEGTGEAIIETGDAYAAANLVNVVNTNVVGRNWFLAVINIFGDWGGNLSFGRPDLWIGGSAEMPDEQVTVGDEVTYRFTVANNGDAKARGVRLRIEDDAPYLSITDHGAVTYVTEENGGYWNIGDLAPGATRDVTYRARVTDDLPYGTLPITTTGRVTSSAKNENNMSDNEEILSVLAFRVAPSGGGSGGGGGRGGGGSNNGSVRGASTSNRNNRPSPSATQAPRLVIDKTASATSTVASSTIDYTVELYNRSRGYAYNAVLIDELTDAQGNIVQRQTWDLGTIFGKERIEVMYTVAFSGNATSGAYVNTAWIEAYKGGDMNAGGKKIVSEQASTTVEIYSSPGTATPPPLVSPFMSVTPTPSMYIGAVVGATAATPPPPTVPSVEVRRSMVPVPRRPQPHPLDSWRALFKPFTSTLSLLSLHVEL